MASAAVVDLHLSSRHRSSEGAVCEDSATISIIIIILILKVGWHPAFIFRMNAYCDECHGAKGGRQLSRMNGIDRVLRSLRADVKEHVHVYGDGSVKVRRPLYGEKSCKCCKLGSSQPSRR